jgi:hypothetical protein
VTTVYVGRPIADKPRVQHLRNPRDVDDLTSLCGVQISAAATHAARRAGFGWRKPLTPINYTRLPMCKRCTRLQEGTRP